MASASTETLVVLPKNLKEFVERCFGKVGATADQADVMSDLLVAADHRGHYSHGLNRLGFYLFDITNGRSALDKEPEVLKQTPATALVEGNNCLGPVVGRFCMDIAIEKAKSVGIGWVCAKGSNHFGIAGWYSMRAMNQGLIGMAFCNTSPTMVPTRATARTLGANPISVAARGSNDEEFVLDMATTSVAMGKVEIKSRLGQDLPLGWAVDKYGKPCTDAEEVLSTGSLCPIGGSEETSGYKGYGLGFMVELFCGILSGSRFGTDVRFWLLESDKNQSLKADLGQCFVAIDPSAFAPGFECRLSELIRMCKDQTPADGDKDILVAGDPERQHMELCSQLGGIPYHAKQLAVADEIAQQYGVKQLVRL